MRAVGKTLVCPFEILKCVIAHSRYKERSMWTDHAVRKSVLATVAVAALVILGASAAAAQFDGGSGPSTGPSTGPGVPEGGFGEGMEGGDAADAVYVRDDGSGVLVYNGTGGDNASVTFGADIPSGLLHLVANGTSESELQGDFSFEAEPSSWLANGSFETGPVETLEDLTLDITSTSNPTESSLDADIDATVSSSFAALAPSATTQGEVVAEPDRFRTSGNVSYRTAFGGSSAREVQRFDLTEDDDGYVLDARERRIVRGQVSVSDEEDPFSEGEGTEGTGPVVERTDPAEDWGTRERARETLSERYAGFAENVSATANLTLESYSFENVTVQTGIGGPTNESLIDVEYTVEYVGVKEGLADTLSEELSGNVSQETADEVAQGVRNLTLNRIAFSTVSGEDGNSLNWSVDVENYNEALTAFMRLSSEMQPSETGMGAGAGAGMGTSPFFSEGYFDEIVNMSESQMEAAEAAGYVSRWEWSGSLESGGAASSSPSSPFGSGGGSGATATVALDLSHSTENWEEYVTELEDRGLPVANSSFDLTASTTDAGGVEGEMRWAADGEGIAEGYQTTLEAYESALRGTNETAATFVEALGASDFRTAKMDASVSGGSWSVEAGAAFGNGSALSSAIETVTGYGVTQVVGVTEDTGTATYVRSDSLVDEPTEEAVRSLDTVDDETTVNLPGDWDRDFPEMDTSAASDYLGVDEGGAGGDEDGSPLPGFGAVAALVALAAVAVALGRRRG